MGFSSKPVSFSSGNFNGSYSCIRKILPCIRSFLKRSNPLSQHKDNLGDHEAGLVRMHMKKAAAVFPGSEIGDINIEKQLNFVDRLSDEIECSWLSSDCKLSSLLSSDDSQDNWGFDFWDTSLHEWFSSMLPASGSHGPLIDKNSVVPVVDGYRINLKNEASSVLERQIGSTKLNNLQEKVIIWLHTNGNGVVDCPLGFLEDGDSSNNSLNEESTESSLFESPSTYLTTYEDAPSYVQDDRTDLPVSLLDLEGVDFAFIQDSEQGFDVFDSNFPSPGARRKSLPGSSDSSSKTSFYQSQIAKSLSEGTASDEPLFWPFDLKSYWRPELENNFLCISPRKDGRSLGTQSLNRSKPSRLRLDQNHKHHAGGQTVRIGCRRRIEFSSLPNSTGSDCKSRALHNKSDQVINTNTSRLSGISGLTQAPLRNPYKTPLIQRSLQLKARRQKHQNIQELHSKNLLEFEASNIKDLVLDRTPIETIVGLSEFDGHEGISVELDGDQFTLPGSPYTRTTSLREMKWPEEIRYQKCSDHANLGSCESKLIAG